MMIYPTKDGIVYYTSKLSYNITNNAIRDNITYIKKTLEQDIITVNNNNKQL